MNIDLNKTVLYETSNLEGRFVLHKTLAVATGANLGEGITNDLNMLLNQAINEFFRDPMNPVSPKATLLTARLVGYLEELSALVGILAEGYRFEVTKDRLGDTAVTVKKLSPGSI